MDKVRNDERAIRKANRKPGVTSGFWRGFVTSTLITIAFVLVGLAVRQLAF